MVWSGLPRAGVNSRGHINLTNILCKTAFDQYGYQGLITDTLKDAKTYGVESKDFWRIYFGQPFNANNKTAKQIQDMQEIDVNMATVGLGAYIPQDRSAHAVEIYGKIEPHLDAIRSRINTYEQELHNNKKPDAQAPEISHP